jgi:hypothetical protein
MSAARWAITVAAGAMLCVGTARAQLQPVTYEAPHPGSAALAAVGNVVFVPVRLVVTAVTAELGGLTGWLTAGNTTAAHDIWKLTDGQGYLQPDMLYGEEPLEFGQLEFQMHVTQP